MKNDILNEAIEAIKDLRSLMETEIYFIGLGNSRKEKEILHFLEEALYNSLKAREILNEEE